MKNLSDYIEERFGKVGTPLRDEYEKELKEELKKEKDKEKYLNKYFKNELDGTIEVIKVYSVEETKITKQTIVRCKSLILYTYNAYTACYERLCYMKTETVDKDFTEITKEEYDSVIEKAFK